MLKRRMSILAVAVVSGGISVAAPPTANAFAPLLSFGPTGEEAGQLASPVDLEVAPSGLLYVTEFFTSRVSVFTPDGQFVRAFGKRVNPSGGDVCTATTGCQRGAITGEPGALFGPAGVAIGPDEAVYVSNRGHHRIEVFEPDGTFIHAIGKGVDPAGGDVCTTTTGCQSGLGTPAAGTVALPAGIDVGPSETLYIATANNRIDKFSVEGGFLSAFGKGVNPSGGDSCTTASDCQTGSDDGSAGAIFGPFDTATGPGGQIAVAESNNRRVSIFSPSGSFVRAFGQGVDSTKDSSQFGVCTASTGCMKGGEGDVAGALYAPAGIVVNGAGNLLVAEFGNNRIDEFTFEGAFLRAFGEGVADGAPAFQVCTVATDCRAGLSNPSPGSIARPYGVLADCRGAIYATALFETPTPFTQVTRFGESQIPYPPCDPPPQARTSTTASPALPPLPSLPPKRRAVRPKIEIELNKGAGTATVIVIVADPGTMVMKGKRVRKVKRRAKHAGLFELLLAPKKKVFRKLKRRGRAKVKFTLVFRPKAGAVSKQAVAVKLQRVRRGF